MLGEKLWQQMPDMTAAKDRGFAMADRAGLRIIGIIAASVTGAVMLIAIVMVHKTVAGELPLESARPSISATH
jgi:hypothetical protein